MSYITDKWDAGEVTVRGLVCGWYFEETGEFRPLMNDAMAELVAHGAVTPDFVEATAAERELHTTAFLAEYIKQQEVFETSPEYAEARAERDFEMRAAFGPGEEVVNVFTGRRYRT